MSAPDLSDALDAEVCDAITGDRLSQWADGIVGSDGADDRRRRAAATIHATCARIRSDTDDERHRLIDVLRAESIEPSSVTTSDQRHAVGIEVVAADAERATAAVEGAGYRRDRQWSGGAARSLWRSSGEVTLTRSSTTTLVARVKWGRSGRSGRRTAFHPTPADWAMVDLPPALWWMYPILRPVRLALERAHVRSRDHAALEPFLVTPQSLIDPLLDVAAVGANDVVLDYGCGDGRMVIAAASRRGCRAIGVEQDSDLAASAAEHVAAGGLTGQVQIIHGDAADLDLDAITVVVMFVPMVVVRRVVPRLLRQLRDGARIVVHEQSALPSDLPIPNRSHPVVAEDAVTIAHTWDIGLAP